MNCEHARSIVDSWQSGEPIGNADLEALSEHIGDCSACRTRYGMILPLIERDVQGVSAGAQAVAARDNLFAKRVMKDIRGRTRRFPQRAGAFSLRWAIPAAAAAAVLVLAAGLLIRGPSGSGTGGEVTVHFVLDAPGVQRVSLVGSFNSWNPDALPLKRAPGSQRWEISLKLKRGETYLYNFVVNGNTWIPDPTSDLQVEDGFGGESSLMQL